MLETVVAVLFLVGVGYTVFRWFVRESYGLNSEWGD